MHSHNLPYVFHIIRTEIASFISIARNFCTVSVIQ